MSCMFAWSCMRIIGDILHSQKAPHTSAWGHFAQPKSPPYMGMGTLCTAKKPPIYGHGDTLHSQKAPHIWAWRHYTAFYSYCIGWGLHRQHMQVVRKLHRSCMGCSTEVVGDLYLCSHHMTPAQPPSQEGTTLPSCGRPWRNSGHGHSVFTSPWPCLWLFVCPLKTGKDNNERKWL